MQREGQNGSGFGSQYNRGKVVSSTTKEALAGVQFSELGLSANTMRCARNNCRPVSTHN